MADHALATISNPSAALTDFTLVVDLSNMPASWWSAVSSSDGTKGRAYKGDGTTRLACDWIDFDDMAETGVLRVLWSGSLASSGTQQLWIEPPVSGNTSVSATDTYGSDNAYDSDWAGYWPNGGGADRTSNGNDGTAYGGVSVGGASGLLGKATDFDGSDDYISLGKPTALDITGNDMFVSALAKTDSTANNARPIIGKGDTQYMLQNHNNDGRFYIYDSGWVDVGVNDVISTVAWFVFSGGVDASGVVRAKVNNANEATIGTGKSIDASSYDVEIGRNSQVTTPYRLFDGKIQHVAVHSTYRSNSWQSQEYDQISDNSTFFGTWSWEEATATFKPFWASQATRISL